MGGHARSLRGGVPWKGGGRELGLQGAGAVVFSVLQPGPVSLFRKVPWGSCSARHLRPFTAPPSAAFFNVPTLGTESPFSPVVASGPTQGLLTKDRGAGKGRASSRPAC